VSEYDFEPIPGLPGDLPPGEVLLWQGSPDWWSLARRVFHVPLIAGYLVLFNVWHIASAAYDGAVLMDTLRSIALLVLMVTVCCGILAALAYANARTTVYSVTSERVILRYGIAFPMAFNLPFSKIETAALKTYGGGFGDITLALSKGEKIAYIMLWPHARPWRISQPQPALRGIPKAEEAAAILGQALAKAASRPATRAQTADAASAQPVATAPAAVAPVQTLRPAPAAKREAQSAPPVARLA
jgi:Bacterial PH domain